MSRRARALRLAAAAGVALAALLGAACQGRPRHEGSGVASSPGASSSAAPSGPGLVLELDLTGGVPESTGGGGLFPRPATRTHTGLVRALERARDHAEATGFFLRLGTASLGFAQTEEVGRLMGELRRARGLPVVCHAHSLGNASTWLLLEACDRIWLSPAGDVDTVGLAGQVIYLKGALDRLSVGADFLHAGRYKSAAEMFTNEGPSEPAREALTATLGSIRDTWLTRSAAARPGVAELRAQLERGPFSADEARVAGLVDAVGYESEARRDAQERASAGRVEVLFGAGAEGPDGPDLAGLIRLLAGAEGRAGHRQVVIVPAEGAIAMSGGGLLDGGGITVKPLTRTLRRLAEDESVAAVVLRIDSPGGSALASDLLWHELRELAARKPLIASVGEMAASGGYYMAVAADLIVAERTSIVGSIGVITGKLVVSDALRQVGVNTVTFPASPEPGAEGRAAWQSPFTPWDAATRARIEQQMNAIYELFLDRVAAGRKRDKAAIRAVAEGRIWSGAQGHERGLVDELGGLGRALALARERGGVAADVPVRVEGASDGLLELLALDAGADERAVTEAVQRLAVRRGRLLDLVPAAVLPLVAGIQPLAQGERTLTLAPWVLITE